MKHSWRSRPLLIAILYFSMFSVGLVNGMRSICTPLIKVELGIGYSEQGLMMALSNVASILASILGGISLERLGAKISLILYAVFLALSLMGMWWAPVFWIYAVFFCIAISTSLFFDTCKNDLNIRCFPKNFAVHASLVSFCVGLGGIVGPYLTSWLITSVGLTTRQIFLVAALLPLLLLGMLITAKFDLPWPTPKDITGASPTKGKFAAAKGSTLHAFLLPATWICGLGLALGNSVGKGMEEWALLYFSDVFAVDPLTTGAGFMSLFFLCMSVAHAGNGFIMEKVGYYRHYLVLIALSIALMGAGLLLGKNGIWLLALCGGIAMSFWPIHGAVMLKSAGSNAASFVAAAYAICSALRALSQWAIGLLNTWLGPAWGFRLLFVYLIALLLIVMKMRKSMPLAKE